MIATSTDTRHRGSPRWQDQLAEAISSPETLIQALGLDPALVRANRQADIQFAEPRPVDVSLDTARLASLLFGAEVKPENVIGESLRRATVPTRLDDPSFIGALAAMHISAALYHHFIRKDAVLMRMVTG